MQTILPTLFSFLLRVVLLAAGLAFAVVLACVFLALAAIWALRALWLKLTGQPVMPFGMRGYPRAAFDQFFRQAAQGRAQAAGRTPRADAASRATAPRWIGEVTDVEPK